MRGIFIALLLFAAMGAQAASVTIDFQEPISFSSASGDTQFVSKGYRFTFPTYGQTPNYMPGIYGVTDRYFSMYDSVGGIGGCSCGGGSLRIEREDGGAFAVESADFDLFVIGAGGFQITGLTGNGASVALSQVPIGSGAWLNLQSFVISVEEADGYSITADNIVVSAVPVPAAAWLFGSALAGLGWINRRRKT